MRHRRRLIPLLFFLLFTGISPAFSLEIPERPDGYVTDHASLLSPSAESALTQLLRAYETQTTNQIVVATFPGLEGESLEDFSIRLAEQWQVGQKERDNGVIFLVFKEDQKMRLEVGYGLEGALPDALAGQILNQVVIPLFQKNEYENGILAGVQAVIRATQGEYEAAGAASPSYGSRVMTPAEIEAMERQGRAIGVFILIAVVIFFVIDFFRYRNYTREHRIYRERYSFWEWWIRFAILLFVLSILFRVLFYAMLFSRGGYYGSRSGFGGFSGGGGGFGGGGASGRW